MLLLPELHTSLICLMVASAAEADRIHSPEVAGSNPANSLPLPSIAHIHRDRSSQWASLIEGEKLARFLIFAAGYCHQTHEEYYLRTPTCVVLK